MDLYTYVAGSNPYQAKAIIHKYGYSTTNVKSPEDLGVCLKKVVSFEGENAFFDVLESHPDKGVLVERYYKKEDYKNYSGDCGCSKSKENYTNASGGDAENKQTSIVGQTSVFILAAALLLAAAIIVKN
jgi:hypothetical protein